MNSRSGQAKGSLTVVGTGIKFKLHMTLETIEIIEKAEKIFYLTSDVMTQKWIEEMNPNSECLQYIEEQPRRETYENWVKLILSSVR